MSDFQQKLAELWRADPEQFNELVNQFIERGRTFDNDAAGPNPREVTDTREKRTAEVMASIWARIKFLMWRDGTDVTQSCRRLENFLVKTGSRFSIYNTDDRRWRKGAESKPSTREYTAFDHQSLRRLYYDFNGLNDEQRAHGDMLLSFMKQDHEGTWQKQFPGLRIMNTDKLVPEPIE